MLTWTSVTTGLCTHTLRFCEILTAKTACVTVISNPNNVFISPSFQYFFICSVHTPSNLVALLVISTSCRNIVVPPKAGAAQSGLWASAHEPPWGLYDDQNFNFNRSSVILGWCVYSPVYLCTIVCTAEHFVCVWCAWQTFYVSSSGMFTVNRVDQHTQPCCGGRALTAHTLWTWQECQSASEHAPWCELCICFNVL